MTVVVLTTSTFYRGDLVTSLSFRTSSPLRFNYHRKARLSFSPLLPLCSPLFSPAQVAFCSFLPPSLAFRLSFFGWTVHSSTFTEHPPSFDISYLTHHDRGQYAYDVDRNAPRLSAPAPESLQIRVGLVFIHPLVPLQTTIVAGRLSYAAARGCAVSRRSLPSVVSSGSSESHAARRGAF